MVDQKHNKKSAPAFRVHPDSVMTPQPPRPVIEAELAELEEKMATGIVASGHSVHINTGKVQRGYDMTLGQPVYRQEFRTAGPGEVVELPVSEIRRLQEIGILVDPDRVIANDITTH